MKTYNIVQWGMGSNVFNPGYRVSDHTFEKILSTDSTMLSIDLDNVLEVDDEYWPVGGQPKQPPGKPSRLSFLNSMIGLFRVLGRALQTIVCVTPLL